MVKDRLCSRKGFSEEVTSEDDKEVETPKPGANSFERIT